MSDEYLQAVRTIGKTCHRNWRIVGKVDFENETVYLHGANND
jgi:hypothetical protein